MTIRESGFGALPDGTQARLFTLTNARGMSVQLCDYGARIVGLFAPDRAGRLLDVVLGHDSVEPYIDADDCLGAICGRYANRLSGGRFQLGGKLHQAPQNDGDNALHGGRIGFHRRLWQAEEIAEGVCFKLLSENEDQGFPGNLQVDVRYLLNDDNVLSIVYETLSDADTIVNLTNHSYFNLAGHDSGAIDAQTLQIFADFYTPSDAALLPTGEIVSVAGTPFDFRSPKPIGRDIDADCPQLHNGRGYDHNFVLNKTERGLLTLAARAEDPVSERSMELWTTLPGVQLYTSNALGRKAGKNGAVYNAREAFCLEPQFFPDSMRHAHFPSPLLKAGDRGSSRSELRFVQP